MAMTSFDVFPICTMVLLNFVLLVFDNAALLASESIYLLLYVWIFHKNFSFHQHVFKCFIINCQISPHKMKILAIQAYISKGCASTRQRSWSTIVLKYREVGNIQHKLNFFNFDHYFPIWKVNYNVILSNYKLENSNRSSAITNIQLVLMKSFHL